MKGRFDESRNQHARRVAPQKTPAVALANDGYAGSLSQCRKLFAMNSISSVRVPFCGDCAKLDQPRGRALSWSANISLTFRQTITSAWPPMNDCAPRRHTRLNNLALAPAHPVW